jgi:hypothetical protein
MTKLKGLVNKELSTLKNSEKVNIKNTKIMATLLQFPQVYLQGFPTVLASVPKNDPKELLCYETFSERKLTHFKKVNYPPNKEVNEYVPPDYLLMTPVFKGLLAKSPNFELDDFENYISNRRQLGKKPVYLLAIKKDKINC